MQTKQLCVMLHRGRIFMEIVSSMSTVAALANDGVKILHSEPVCYEHHLAF
jgi:hypothetical protein